MSSAYVPSALRQLVYERARGRCEYCLISEMVTFASHEIDHIISQKHGGPTEAGNLALCCVLCNKHKGTDIASLDPTTGEIVPLYHPRRDRWLDHFQLIGAQIIPLTPKGRATARLLQLNHPDRVEERELLIAAGVFSLPD
ncbi:MAG: HNH endonuclease [candidate division KSB1 bacterium]|nr:HNH endonuclease [candidate division KSB1 bacterium]MDZ7302135.1 HNH endonuclease [candidate division KSB1 bacterium]MDZ7311245.1 HNH endonuclease [candidate division KSB1 bacterium]